MNKFNDDEIDIFELIRVSLLNFKFIFTTSIIFSLLGLVILFNTSKVYQSTAVLTYQEEDSAQSSLLSQYGGVASMAGFDLGSLGDSGSGRKVIYATLNSNNFLHNFITNRDIMVDLIASKGFDSDNNKLIIDNKIYDEKNKKWIRDYSYPQQQIPSLLEASKRLTDHISITEDTKKNLVTISVKHHSPVIANNWATWMVEDINMMIKNLKIIDSKLQIEFLLKEVENTNLSELKSLFYKLIEYRTKDLMLAETREEYALRSIDPPFIPEEEISPNKILYIILSFIFGLFISLIIVYFVNSKDQWLNLNFFPPKIKLQAKEI